MLGGVVCVLAPDWRSLLNQNHLIAASVSRHDCIVDSIGSYFATQYVQCYCHMIGFIVLQHSFLRLDFLLLFLYGAFPARKTHFTTHLFLEIHHIHFISIYLGIYIFIGTRTNDARIPPRASRLQLCRQGYSHHHHDNSVERSNNTRNFGMSRTTFLHDFHRIRLQLNRCRFFNRILITCS